ncbi:MAG: hypothetical protein ACFFBD_04175 [Candidatus Hodarchaeota archaeon]
MELEFEYSGVILQKETTFELNYLKEDEVELACYAAWSLSPVYERDGAFLHWLKSVASCTRIYEKVG